MKLFYFKKYFKKLLESMGLQHIIINNPKNVIFSTPSKKFYNDEEDENVTKDVYDMSDPRHSEYYEDDYEEDENEIEQNDDDTYKVEIDPDETQQFVIPTDQNLNQQNIPFYNDESIPNEQLQQQAVMTQPSTQPVQPQIQTPPVQQPLPQQPIQQDPTQQYMNPQDPSMGYGSEYGNDMYDDEMMGDMEDDGKLGNSRDIESLPVNSQDINRIEDLKFIHRKLLEIRRILENEISSGYEKIEEKVQSSYEYFTTVIKNLDSFSNNIDDIILKFKRFIFIVVQEINNLKELENDEE